MPPANLGNKQKNAGNSFMPKEDFRYLLREESYNTIQEEDGVEISLDDVPWVLKE